MLKSFFQHAYRDIERARELKEREEQKVKRAPFRPLQSNVAPSSVNRGVKIDGLLKNGQYIPHFFQNIMPDSGAKMKCAP